MRAERCIEQNDNAVRHHKQNIFRVDREERLALIVVAFARDDDIGRRARCDVSAIGDVPHECGVRRQRGDQFVIRQRTVFAGAAQMIPNVPRRGQG